MDENDGEKRIEKFYKRFSFFDKPDKIVFEDVGNGNGYYARKYKNGKVIEDAIVIDRNFSFDVLLHENVHKKLHDKGITNIFIQEFIASNISYIFDPKALFVKILIWIFIFYNIMMESSNLIYSLLLSSLIFILLDAIVTFIYLRIPKDTIDNKVLRKLNEGN